VDFLTGALILASPFVLAFGWVLYFKLPSHSGWRTRISLVALCAPVLSFMVWIVTLIVISQLRRHGDPWPQANPAINFLIAAGCWIALGGALLGLAGRLKLIAPILITCAAVFFLWIGSTVP
jgi:hypothetical protein